MKQHANTICIRNVQFQKINEQVFNNINLSDLKFFIILRSGLIDKPGNLYFFSSTEAFFINTYAYKNNLIENFLSRINKSNWYKINLYFCDDLFINTQIHDFFIHELCTRNIRDFWFETAIDMYKDKTLGLST